MRHSGIEAKYPNLAQLFTKYLHQDWTVEHLSGDAVVKYFISHSPKKLIAQVYDELNKLCGSRLDENSFRASIGAIGSYYAEEEGLTYKEWIVHLKANLQGNLDKAK